MYPIPSFNLASQSGVSGPTSSAATSGNSAHPVVIDDFTKWALLGAVALVGVVLVVRLR